ncbi:MAG TPA: lysylphosphatidylglycerol synthase domain-containing protein [Solirubrobacteraceae bacterium]|nr:lysylphosphatidylglycerol synthase domain-containing protein [Solirubrobacteraceae bacterium]
MGESAVSAVEPSTRSDHARHALAEVRSHLKRRALKLVGFLLVVYAVLKLIPAFEQALHTLEHASWEWVLALLALEVLSEAGFIFAWSAIVDPQNVLGRDGRGRRMDEHVAWAQLGGGLLLPGGSWGGMGLGGVILHRFGMPTKLIAERQLNLSFLNTGIDALALVVFGLGLATGIFAGEDKLLLTLLPAAVAAAGVAAAVLLAPHASARAKRLEAKHGKIATTITTLAAAVEDTKRLLTRRGTGTAVLGVMSYLVFDVLVLWCAFLAVNAHPFPGFPIVIMAYIIGALGGSLPLPAAAGTIGGMAGMLILYGVADHAALAAVLLHQAIGLLVPLTGGAIAYTILRHRFGPIRRGAASDPVAPQTGA